MRPVIEIPPVVNLRIVLDQQSRMLQMGDDRTVGSKLQRDMIPRGVVSPNQGKFPAEVEYSYQRRLMPPENSEYPSGKREAVFFQKFDLPAEPRFEVIEESVAHGHGIVDRQQHRPYRIDHAAVPDLRRDSEVVPKIGIHEVAPRSVE